MKDEPILNTQFCHECGEDIWPEDYGEMVEDGDGNTVCGRCYQGSVDNANDAIKDARSMGELGGE